MIAEDEFAETVYADVARVFRRDRATLTRETRFVEDLGVTSLTMAQLIALLEEDLGVSIPFMEARRRTTLGEAIDFVTELRHR